MKPDIEQLRPGVYSLLLDGRSYLIYATGELVSINGHEDRIALQDPRDRGGIRTENGAAAQRDVKSAMPGKVVRLLVKPGDSVEPGQGLLILEAMKMQNEVRAKGSGRVVKIAVEEGGTVAAGQLLVRLE